MTKQMEEFTDQELKSIAYDNILDIEQAQQNLVNIKNELANRQRQIMKQQMAQQVPPPPLAPPNDKSGTPVPNNGPGNRNRNRNVNNGNNGNNKEQGKAIMENGSQDKQSQENQHE